MALVAALALPLPGLSVALILPAGPALAQGGKAQGGAHRGGGRSETGGRGGRDTGAERGGARGGRDTGGGRDNGGGRDTGSGRGPGGGRDTGSGRGPWTEKDGAADQRGAVQGGQAARPARPGTPAAQPAALAGGVPRATLDRYRASAARARAEDARAIEIGTTYVRLLDTTKDRFEAANPGLTYEETLAAYDAAYRQQLGVAARAQQDAAAALLAVTGGRRPTDAALAELNAALGL